MPCACERCLRRLSDNSPCPRHPYAEPLRLDRPDEHALWKTMLGMRRDRRVRSSGGLAVLAIAGAYTVLFSRGGWGLVSGPLLVVPATMLTCIALAGPAYLLSLLAESIWPKLYR